MTALAMTAAVGPPWPAPIEPVSESARRRQLWRERIRATMSPQRVAWMRASRMDVPARPSLSRAVAALQEVLRVLRIARSSDV